MKPHIRRRILLVVVAFIALLAVSPVSPLFWKLAQMYYEPSKQEAMRFCESLVPLVEAARQENGSYPTQPDPRWLKDRKVPKLINPKHFYSSSYGFYILYFWNPGEFWDDFWALDSRSGRWLNYDADKPRD